MTMDIRRIEQANRAAIDNFIMRQWLTMRMVVRGESINLENADGWYVCESDEIVGLITYRVLGDAIEILSLDSIHENQGIGTVLLNEVISEAKNSGKSGVVVITTNDNLPALRFYQKRGFDIINLYRNAVDQARRLKPEIPMTGMDGIPLRHEIELQRIL